MLVKLTLSVCVEAPTDALRAETVSGSGWDVTPRLAARRSRDLAGS